MLSDEMCVIGVCATSIHMDRYAELLQFIHKEAAAAQFKLLIFASYHDLQSCDSYAYGEKSIFYNIPFPLLKGMILLTESFKDPEVPAYVAKQCQEQNIPVFSIDTELPGCYNILYDDSGAFGQLVTHIVEHHGCKRINLLAGARNTPCEQNRTNQYRSVLEAHGIPVEEDRIYYGDFWDIPTYEAIERMLQSPLPFPEAIVCENDSMAIAACRRLKEYQISAPEDVLITGLDGLEQAFKHMPSITTAKQDHESCAKLIFRLFADICAGISVKPTHLIPYHICIEQSCGCKELVYTDSNNILHDALRRWENTLHYEAKLVSMQNDTIRLSYRDFLPKLEPYLPDLSWLCLTSEYNTFLTEPSAYKGYNHTPPFLTERMNCVIKRFYNEYSYNSIYPLSDFLPSLSEEWKQHSAILFIPLHFQEQLFGYYGISLDYYAFDFDMVRRFTSSLCAILQVIQEQERVRMLYQQMAIANQKLTDLYNLDPLTGLSNRRGFFDSIKKCMEQEDNCRKQFVIFSIDMDGLKDINDTYGHKEGDYSICMISDCLKYMSHKYEELICARFGGDEFIMAGFFPYLNITLEALSTDFSNQLDLLNSKSGKAYTITASVGQMQVPVDAGFDVEACINSADAHMYQNKQARKSAKGHLPR